VVFYLGINAKVHNRLQKQIGRKCENLLEKENILE